ncbi:hypothetical protein [Azospirillum sp. TSH58]|uniref:hypothetical protein n=1 Tax=Azospirillum sp. TSH58 TaxID=664962 RepID=UPI0013A5ABC6|nr:hypothetical protein [Azospirillum sp. TSH58]
MADSVNTTPLPGTGRRKSAGALVPTKPADLPPLTPDQLNDQDGEPRVSDLVLAERLGFDKPHNIRKLIERNRRSWKPMGRWWKLPGFSPRWRKPLARFPTGNRKLPIVAAAPAKPTT